MREIGFSEAIHFVPLFLMSVLLATTPEGSGHRCGTIKFYFTLDCHRKQFVPIERVHSAIALLPPRKVAVTAFVATVGLSMPDRRGI